MASQKHIDGDLQDQAVGEYHSDLGITDVQTADLPGLRTDSGFQFESIRISYQTLGKLSPKKDNVVLVCHALSGDAHVAGISPATGRPGWWDFHVGPGKAIDTNRFYVVGTNVLGGCSGSTGPSSTNPATGRPFATDFPPVTVRDMVAAQAALLDHLGIGDLFAVIGGSMGGMQALLWAAHYPDRVRLCVPIATCLAHNAMQIAFNEIGRQAILTDPNWRDGRYYETNARPIHGLAVARMVGHVTYLSEYSLGQKFGRRLQRPPQPEDLFPDFFSVESYLHHQGDSFVRRFDPNSYLYLTKAIDRFDFLAGREAREALDRVKARFLVISFESDWLYPPSQSREMVRLLKRHNLAVSYLNLTTPYGHDSFLIQNPEFSRALHQFFAQEHGSASP
ncbi:MAG: homoserine O-acetyltransferase [Verrucomicrobiota bacterium]